MRTEKEIIQELMLDIDKLNSEIKQLREILSKVIEYIEKIKILHGAGFQSTGSFEIISEYIHEISSKAVNKVKDD